MVASFVAYGYAARTPEPSSSAPVNVDALVVALVLGIGGLICFAVAVLNGRQNTDDVGRE